MKIGIAIITRNRQDILNICIVQHFKYSIFDKLIIVDDHSDIPVTNPLPAALTSKMQIVRPPKWSGVAGARNFGLSMIDDCDYMFIMDDDVFPKAHGWVSAYCTVLGRHHRMPNLAAPAPLQRIEVLGGMPNEWGHIEADYGPFVITKGTTGVLFALTQYALHKIGGFDGFGAKYGFDDADYFRRAHAAGLTPFGAHCTIADFEHYFHVCDIDGDFEGFKWPGKSSLGESKHDEIAIAGPNYFSQNSDVIYKPYK